MPGMAGKDVLCDYVVRAKYQVFFAGSWRLIHWKEQNRSHQCVAAGKWVGAHQSKIVLGQIRRELMCG